VKRFIIEQSDKEFYTSNSGLVLVGHCINELCPLPVKARQTFPVSSGGIGMDDILRSYVGLLSMGQSDFEAITNRREDEYFRQALGIGRVPSTETLRQRLDEFAPDLLAMADACSVEFSRRQECPSPRLRPDTCLWTAMSLVWTIPRPKKKEFLASTMAGTVLPRGGLPGQGGMVS